MQKILGTAAVVVLTAMLLTGCGGDDDAPSGSSAYCNDLQAAKDEFSGLLNNEIGQDEFVELRDSLPALVADAPARLTGAWTTFNDAVQTFSDAMDKAGLTMDDMREMGTGKMAGGVDMQTAMDAAAALGSAKLSTAQSRITADALKECDVNLNP